MVISRVLPAVVLALVMGATAGVGQEGGGAASPPAAPEAAPGWVPPPPFEDTRNQRQDIGPSIRSGPSSISGTVKRADGEALPGDAVVEVVCQGHALAATTTRGRFQLIVPARGGAPGLDAAPRLVGCEVRARLSGFQQATVAVGSLSPGGVEIGWVVLHPQGDASGFAYTATTGLAPKEAQKAWEKGRTLLAKGKRKEAVEQLRKATSLYSRFAVAWFELGIAYHQMGEAEEARKAYAAAIEADPLYLPPYVQMAMLAAAQRAWPVVEELTAEVIRRNPYEFPQAFLYHAAASYNLGKLEEAEKSARRAMELDTPGRLTRAYLLLARILMDTNRREEAETVITRYLELTEGKPEAEEGRELLRRQPSQPRPFLFGGEQG